jgi:hypothetical protein
MERGEGTLTGRDTSIRSIKRRVFTEDDRGRLASAPRASLSAPCHLPLGDRVAVRRSAIVGDLNREGSYFCFHTLQTPKLTEIVSFSNTPHQRHDRVSEPQPTVRRRLKADITIAKTTTSHAL